KKATDRRSGNEPDGSHGHCVSDLHGHTSGAANGSLHDWQWGGGAPPRRPRGTKSPLNVGLPANRCPQRGHPLEYRAIKYTIVTRERTARKAPNAGPSGPRRPLMTANPSTIEPTIPHQYRRDWSRRRLHTR